MSFAISFDLNVKLANQFHPKRSQQAYADIAVVLSKHGFSRIQASVYASEHRDLARLFAAIQNLRELGWFGLCVKNIRAFRMENGSDFTAVIKGESDPKKHRTPGKKS